MTKMGKVFLLSVAVLVALGPLPFASPLAHAAPLAVAAPADAPASPFADSSSWFYLLPAIGAIRIKDTANLAKKFVTRAGAASKDYEEGVKAAGQDWEANTKAAADNYRTAVTQAAGEGRFERGVAAAGAARFVQKASTHGAQRFGPGVQAAEADWARGSQPFLDALKGMELPPRRPRGQNAARADAVAQRLHAMRVGK